MLRVHSAPVRLERHVRHGEPDAQHTHRRPHGSAPICSGQQELVARSMIHRRQRVSTIIHHSARQVAQQAPAARATIGVRTGTPLTRIRTHTHGALLDAQLLLPSRAVDSERAGTTSANLTHARGRARGNRAHVGTCMQLDSAKMRLGRCGCGMRAVHLMKTGWRTRAGGDCMLYSSGRGGFAYLMKIWSAAKIKYQTPTQKYPETAKFLFCLRTSRAACHVSSCMLRAHPGTPRAHARARVNARVSTRVRACARTHPGALRTYARTLARTLVGGKVLLVYTCDGPGWVRPSACVRARASVHACVRASERMRVSEREWRVRACAGGRVAAGTVCGWANRGGLVAHHVADRAEQKPNQRSRLRRRARGQFADATVTSSHPSPSATRGVQHCNMTRGVQCCNMTRGIQHAWKKSSRC
jgi:hypothetical protein